MYPITTKPAAFVAPATIAPIATDRAKLIAAAVAHNTNAAYAAAGYPQISPYTATIETPRGPVVREFNAPAGEALDRLLAISADARHAHGRLSIAIVPILYPVEG